MARTNPPATPALPAPEGAKPARQKKSKGGALATMADLQKLFAARGQEAAAAAPVAEGVPRISAKDGVFWVGEVVLPDPLKVIVVAESLLNVWYEEEYDPENPSPPSCFAVGYPAAGDPDGKKTMAAHETSPNIQGGAAKDGIEHPCATCEMNQFGSARIGRGKACGNYRNLAVVMADDPALLDPKKDLKYAILGISPTGLSHWGKYVTGIYKQYGLPPEGVVTHFTFNKTDADERKRKAVIPDSHELYEPAIGARVLALRQEILESGVLVRPLPVEVRAKPEKKAGRGAPAKGKAAAAAKAKRAAARF